MIRGMVDRFTDYEEYTTPNWDGYGARPISAATVQAARWLAQGMTAAMLNAADIAPGGDGSIGFEWPSSPFKTVPRGLRVQVTVVGAMDMEPDA